jgi:restriction system protein
MAFWLVRAGRHGEEEQGALEHNVVTIAWNELPDLSNIKDRESLKELYFKILPQERPAAASNRIGQVWNFLKEIKKGDLVALPLKSQSAIALGRIEGDYNYTEMTPTIRHIRPVKWLKTIPRSHFDQDLLFSLGAFMTVCRIKRNDAENRIAKMLQNGGAIVKSSIVETIDSSSKSETIEAIDRIDIEQYAKDRIMKHIGAKFAGHNLARLVESVLRAQGYITTKSEPGKDGGIDILAGSGPLGFNEPLICAQIKSSSSPIDVRVLRELQGVMQRVNAKQGLLVAWGGFTKDAMQEAKSVFFSIRLWHEGNLLDEIWKYYEIFGDELKAELPLKRIWTLVEEKDEPI